jgi:hypothetical protein
VYNIVRHGHACVSQVSSLNSLNTKNMLLRLWQEFECPTSEPRLCCAVRQSVTLSDNVAGAKFTASCRLPAERGKRAGWHGWGKKNPVLTDREIGIITISKTARSARAGLEIESERDYSNSYIPRWLDFKNIFLKQSIMRYFLNYLHARDIF